MLTRFAGFFVGAAFGLAFVLINSGPPLPATLALTLRTLAVVAAAAIVVLVLLAIRKGDRESGKETEISTAPPGALRFGPFFGLVTAVEVALIIGGAQTIGRLDGVPDQAGVAWVALVVGLHFFPLAWYWKQKEILVVAGYATVLGSTGLVMALTGHPGWVPLISGVVTGAGMLLGLLTALVLMRRRPAVPAGTNPSNPTGGSPT